MPCSTQVRTSRKPGSGDARRARIRHQRRIAATGDRGGHRLHGGVLVELVVRAQRLFNAQVMQQHRRGARILGQDQIDLAQHAHGAERDVVEVAYGRGYEIERP